MKELEADYLLKACAYIENLGAQPSPSFISASTHTRMLHCHGDLQVNKSMHPCHVLWRPEQGAFLLATKELAHKSLHGTCHASFTPQLYKAGSLIGLQSRQASSHLMSVCCHFLLQVESSMWRTGL